jgi:hypothetical protein
MRQLANGCMNGCIRLFWATTDTMQFREISIGYVSSGNVSAACGG